MRYVVYSKLSSETTRRQDRGGANIAAGSSILIRQDRNLRNLGHKVNPGIPRTRTCRGRIPGQPIAHNAQRERGARRITSPHLLTKTESPGRTDYPFETPQTASRASGGGASEQLRNVAFRCLCGTFAEARGGPCCGWVWRSVLGLTAG